MIENLENNDSNHEITQNPNKPNSQENTFKTSGKMNKSMRYKK
jgi:hypothetical protein